MDVSVPLNAFFASGFPILDNIPFIRLIIASLLVFFLPGFAWSLLFFKHLSVLERCALSFGLSLVVVTLSIVFANVAAKIKITGLSSLLIIILITAVPAIIYSVSRILGRKKSKVV